MAVRHRTDGLVRAPAPQAARRIAGRASRRASADRPGSQPGGAAPLGGIGPRPRRRPRQSCRGAKSGAADAHRSRAGIRRDRLRDGMAAAEGEERDPPGAVRRDRGDRHRQEGGVGDAERRARRGNRPLCFRRPGRARLPRPANAAPRKTARRSSARQPTGSFLDVRRRDRPEDRRRARPHHVRRREARRSREGGRADDLGRRPYRRRLRAGAAAHGLRACHSHDLGDGAAGRVPIRVREPGLGGSMRARLSPQCRDGLRRREVERGPEELVRAELHLAYWGAASALPLRCLRRQPVTNIGKRHSNGGSPC